MAVVVRAYGCKVNHVERRTPLNRIPDHAGIDIELAGKRVREGLDVREFDFGDEVDVLRGARGIP